MEKKQKIEKTESGKGSRRIWNRILIYIICLLIAVGFWTVANYDLWSKQDHDTENDKDKTPDTSETVALISHDLLSETTDGVLYG